MMSEFESRPQITYAINLLTSKDQGVSEQIAEINRLHWYTHKPASSASQSGFTVPGEYGDIQSRIDASLKPGSDTRFLYITAPNGKVIGYREIEEYPEGEDPEEFRNVFSDEQANIAISSPHIEGRESAIHPNWRSLLDERMKKPSELLLEATETYCAEHNYPYLFIWIIGPYGPHIPNKASWKFFTRHGYTPAFTAEGDISETKAAGLYKKIAPLDDQTRI